MKRLTMIIGGALVAIGIRELVDGARWSTLRATITWFVGGPILHDAVLVPLTLLVGLALARLVPGTYRGLVQGALIVSATVTIALLPLLSGRGRTAANPSQQPLAYGQNLLVVLAGVWVGAAILGVWRHHRARRQPAPTT